MADTIEVAGSSDEVEPFAQLWAATPEDDGDMGRLRTQMAQRPLVIQAERV